MTSVEETVQILKITATFQYINECMQFHFYIFYLLLLFLIIIIKTTNTKCLIITKYNLLRGY